MKTLQRGLLSIIILLNTHFITEAQEKKNIEFGNGILNYVAADSSFTMKMGARIQNRYDGIYTQDVTDGDPAFVSRNYVKRGRLKFDGWVLSPKMVYKIEFDIVGGYVRDAFIKYNFYKNLSVQYGLGKLPGNRERVVSSQKLQFVDRSLFNDYFNIDRDNGVWIYHHFKMGKSVVKETFAYTQGRGINDYGAHEGNSYTGRVDLLPFGEFTDKGDYFYADFAREKTPKLMLGGVYNYNYKARDSQGQNGFRLSDSRNLSAIFADMMLKYNGFNLSAEYCNKVTDNDNPVVAKDSLGNVIEAFGTGEGYVTQLAYLFKNNIEVGARYTEVRPETGTGYPDIFEYTLGMSKYLQKHNFKIQTDISYRDKNQTIQDGGEQIIYRFQIELSF